MEAQKMKLPIYGAWSVDWQDDYLRGQAGLFARVSQQIIELMIQELNGKVTWFAEIDQRCDVTKYPEFPMLAKEIIANKGEIGIHIHHRSVDPRIRREDFIFAVSRLQDLLEIEVKSYSAGMANFLPFDIQALLGSGIVCDRSAFPFYKTGEPSDDPAACDWVGVDERAGYVDPNNPKRINPHGRLFRIPLGANPRNGDGRHQLHIHKDIRLETLGEVFDYCRKKDPFVSAYFHPYDFTECEDRLTKRVLQRFMDSVRYQRECGAVFLTHLEAKRIFDKHQGSTEG